MAIKSASRPPQVRPVAPATRAWLLLDQSRPLVYRKEAIYLGDWKKIDRAKNGVEFTVATDTLNWWARSVDQLRQAGIKIPLSKSSDHGAWQETENRLGEVVAGHVGRNDQGQAALFLDIAFDDERARDLALKGDVSIGSPDVWIDGRGREWHYPLQHVALTQAPVIPALGDWKKIAASFAAANGGTKMDEAFLDELIAAMGLSVSEEADAAAKMEVIRAALKSKGAPPAEEDPDAEMSQDGKAAPPAAKPATEGAGGAAQQVKRVSVAFSHPLVVKTIRQGREAQIDALVEQKQISPAVAKELKLAHCQDAAIKLELAHGEEDGREFDNALKLVKLLAKEKPLADSGRSPFVADEAAITLSHSEEHRNILVKNAEARAKAAGMVA